jgi:hypothetical protein
MDMSPRFAMLALPAGLLLLPVVSAQQPSATVGWYNGEWQSGIPGLANWYFERRHFARVYDEFEVPGDGWVVVGVFSDNAFNVPTGRQPAPWEIVVPVSHASWEIRRDMSPGRGGKLVACRISRAIQMPDPSVTSPPYPAGEPERHFRIQVEGLRLRLPAGHYWLNVAPVVGGQVILCATSGAHAVALEPGSFGKALFHSSDGAAYVPAESAAFGGANGHSQAFFPGRAHRETIGTVAAEKGVPAVTRAAYAVLQFR